MEQLFSFFVYLVQEDIIGETFLLLIIIGMLIIIYKYVLSQISKNIINISRNVEKIPTKTDIVNIFSQKNKNDDEKIREVISQLDNFEEKLNKLQTTSDLGREDIKELKEEVEKIKTILIQIHGHLLYSSNHSFKELK